MLPSFFAIKQPFIFFEGNGCTPYRWQETPGSAWAVGRWRTSGSPANGVERAYDGAQKQLGPAVAGPKTQARSQARCALGCQGGARQEPRRSPSLRTGFCSARYVEGEANQILFFPSNFMERVRPVSTSPSVKKDSSSCIFCIFVSSYAFSHQKNILIFLLCFLLHHFYTIFTPF